MVDDEAPIENEHPADEQQDKVLSEINEPQQEEVEDKLDDESKEEKKEDTP